MASQQNLATQASWFVSSVEGDYGVMNLIDDNVCILSFL